MQHFDEFGHGRLWKVLCVIIAPGHLQGRPSQELGSPGNRGLEGDAVHTAHLGRDKQRIDIGVGIERRDMASKPGG